MTKWNAIFLVISLLLSMTFGAYAIEQSWTMHCKTFGMFRHENVVYKCFVMKEQA